METALAKDNRDKAVKTNSPVNLHYKPVDSIVSNEKDAWSDSRSGEF